MTQYAPGDVVNGHRLNETGTEWVPVDPAFGLGTTPPPPAKKGMSTGKKIGLGVGGGFLALIALGAVVGETESTTTQETAASAAAPAEDETTAVEDEGQEAADTTTEQEASAATADEVEMVEEPVAVEEAEVSSEYGTYPADQADFVARVEAGRDDIESASTDLKESAALRQRDRDLAAILGSGLSVKGWVGTISEVGANGEGKAYVEVEIASNTRVGTWNNAFSDILDDTLIPENSRMFDSLLELEEGDQVVFSGKFFRGSDTALEGKNMTETFYGHDPKFLFKFTSIKAA